MKKYNFAEMNAATLETLSAFSISCCTFNDIKKGLVESLNKANAALLAQKDARREAMESGKMSADEAINAFPLLELEKDVNTANAALEAAKKANKAVMDSALALVPDSIFTAYEAAESEHEAYVKSVAEFLANLGFTEGRGAEECADYITSRIGYKAGNCESCESGKYWTPQSKRSFKVLFLRGFLTYVVLKKKCFLQTEGGKLEVRKFEAITEQMALM